MELNHGQHLAYCTNIHRGESWEETLAALESHTLDVKSRVCPGRRYAIGLRLSAEAARKLTDQSERDSFKRWLEKHNCYVFTINGFPYGRFHGTRVKEQVFQPDWATRERVEYTRTLMEIAADLAPADTGASVSTVPGSHKELVGSPAHAAAIQRNLREAAEFVARLSDRTGRDLHLGIEPEPLGWIEDTTETIQFFEATIPQSLRRYLGVNYDACHLAVEYEDPERGLRNLHSAGIRISKIHFSSALTLQPDPESLRRLQEWTDDVYFHQTIARHSDGALQRFRDLDAALAFAAARPGGTGVEWRVHFHIPLHSPPGAPFGDTRGHLTSVMDVLAADPALCRHLEMETYTWEVLPPAARTARVTDQLVREYEWTLGELRRRKLAA